MRNAVKKTTLQFRTREQKWGSNSGRPVVNNQLTGKPKRTREWHPPGWKSHSDPIIGSRRSRRTCQNSALAENPREVEVETVEQHQKATRQQAEENGTQSRPARRRKPQPSSLHASWAHEDGDCNRKGEPAQNKARKPRSEMWNSSCPKTLRSRERTRRR